MMSLQHTTLEATQALLRQSLSIQRQTARNLKEELRQQEALQHQALALSWSVFYGPLADDEDDTNRTVRSASEEFCGPGASHRSRDVASEDTSAEAVGEEASNGWTSRSRDDSDDTEPSMADVEELSEPSTEVETDEPESTGDGIDGTEDEEGVAGDTAEGAENGAVGREPSLQDRIHGIGDAHRDSLHRAGIESVVDLADARPDTVAEEAGVSRERAAEWIERAGAVATRDLDVIDGIGDAHASDLHDGGIETVPALAEADVAGVASITGVSEDRAAGWVDDARSHQQKQLQTIEGIGETRAAGLRDSDIETLADLATADAGHVAEAVDVSRARAAKWIRSAQA